MNKNIWQKVQPHAIAIAIFLLVSVLYCLPALKGLVVNQHDVIGWKGMAQQSMEVKEKTGHYPLWTNSLFGGMPAYAIAMESKYNITIASLDYIFRFFLPSPASLFFLSCICFYILCMVLRTRTWVAIFGSLAYAFASYNAILVAVGHTTKFASMGYAPAVIAGFILLTQRKYIWGFISVLLFSTLLFYQSHIQIVYYTLITLFCCAAAFSIKCIKEKDWKHLITTGSLGIIAALISAASYAVVLLPTNEYAKETMRGGRSELTLGKKKEEKTIGGLDKEYAFRWSYGIDETMTIALPAYKGGSSGPSELGENSKAAESLFDNSRQAGLSEQYAQYLSNFLSSYWGPQASGTSGPVYFGVLVILLFIVGLFLVKSWHRGWIVAASLFGLILAWGSNVSSINYFLFDHLPYYNKFRAPSIAMVIPQLTFALLATLGLQSLLYGNLNPPDLWKKLKPAAIVAGLVVLVLVGTYFTSDFKSPGDKERKEQMTGIITQMTGQQPNSQVNPAAFTASVFKGLSEDRKHLYGSDLIRSLLFFILGGALVFLTVKRKLAPLYSSIAFALLLLIDLLPVDLRYLNNKNYVSKDEYEEVFTPNRADLQIKQDTGYFRVFDRDHDFKDDSRSAYHHNSVGGYSPAKLGLYQDLIEYQLGKGNMQLFNMLNTKYFIIPNQNDQQPMALPNSDNIGACWFVKNISYVNNANEEMTALDSIKPRDTVYIDKREQSKVTVTPQPDSSAFIRLIRNQNDLINYESQSTTNQFAIFSEIYYPYGWKAFVDGKEQPIVRVNYAFRGLALAAGNHKIEFRFDPQTKKTGDLLSLIIGIVSWILLIGGLLLLWKNYRKKQLATVKA